MTHRWVNLTAFVSAWFMAGSAEAFLAGNPVELSWHLRLVHADGTSQQACSQAPLQAANGRQEWAFHVTPAPADNGRKRQDGSALVEVQCGGPPEASAADGTQEVREWVFSAAGTVQHSLVRQMEYERVLTVNIRAKAGLWTIVDEETAAPEQPVEIDRYLAFGQSDTASIPLWLRGHHPGEIAGVEEVYLVLSVHEPLPAEDARFGSIGVMSDGPGREVYLDGGLVGQTDGGGDLQLANVPAGAHILELGQPNGSRQSAPVRVQPGRKAVADFKEDRAVNRSFTLTPLGPNAQGFQEFERSSDGATVVEIPAGEFLMGNEETERSPLEHMVYASTFRMDKTGVTWRQYKRFAAQTGISLPPHTPYWGMDDDQPAVYVTWEESKAYCEWAGGRLPTEAEREKAARGLDGRMYPWGDEEPNEKLAVFRRSWGYSGAAEVGTHPAGISPYGLHDMGGNLWEWCSDWYDIDYYQHSPFKDPEGPASGISHVVRGGSWDSRPSVLSASCRNWGHVGYRDGDFGFRCAMNAPE